MASLVPQVKETRAILERASRDGRVKEATAPLREALEGYSDGSDQGALVPFVDLPTFAGQVDAGYATLVALEDPALDEAVAAVERLRGEIRRYLR